MSSDEQTGKNKVSFELEAGGSIRCSSQKDQKHSSGNRQRDLPPKPIRPEQEQEQDEEREELLQQALLYWKIANASKTPLLDRVSFLMKKGLSENDIDDMIAIVSREAEKRKKYKQNGLGIPDAWKVDCGKPKQLLHHCPGQRERRVLENVTPGPGAYDAVDSSLTRPRAKGKPFGRPQSTGSVGRKRRNICKPPGYKVMLGPGSYDAAHSSLRKNGVHMSQTTREVAAKVLAYDGAKKESDYKQMGAALNRPFVGQDSPGPAMYFPDLPKSKYEKSFSIGALNVYDSVEKSKRGTPGPMSYRRTPALGKQNESGKRTASSASFGKGPASRSDWITVKKGPGPDHYRTRGKEATLSQHKSSSRGVKFSDVEKKHYIHALLQARSQVPDPLDYSDGAAKTTLCRQVNSKHKNDGGTVFGSSRRPGLFFLMT